MVWLDTSAEVVGLSGMLDWDEPSEDVARIVGCCRGRSCIERVGCGRDELGVEEGVTVGTSGWWRLGSSESLDGEAMPDTR